MSTIRTEERPALSHVEQRDMDRYGIIRVPADSFHYREFRYTNLQDALAQAKRDADESQSRAGAGPLGQR